MDQDTIYRLFPLPGEEVTLRGLYLREDVRSRAAQLGRAFIYTNYVSSLDGRIAIPHPSGSGMVVPSATANDRDWRLFQELAVQADAIITSGRYLRDYADGRAQEILRVYDDPRFSDLVDWRLSRGLSPQPDLIVISGSLDFPIPEALAHSDRRVIIFTHAGADADRRRALEQQLGVVMLAGDSDVEGKKLVAGMTELGYRTVYMATGPRVNHLLLDDDVLDRLYITLTPRLLGGRPFSSIVEGDLLQPTVDMTLSSLYFDPHGLDGLGQLFVCHDRASIAR